MPDQLSAWQLILNGDPALFAIVKLSLAVSLSAAIFAGGAAQCADGIAAGGGRASGLSAAVALRAARGHGHSVHAVGDGDRPDYLDRADHRGADAPDRRGSLGGVSR